MNYISWALLGMVGYSFTTLLVKLATKTGEFSSFVVLTIACIIVTSSAACIVLVRHDLHGLSFKDLASQSALFSYATGVALAVAVISLFRALSLGPASTVVPIYGMFIVGASVLGFLFLGEAVTVRKLAGIGFAVVSIFLLAKRG